MTSLDLIDTPVNTKDYVIYDTQELPKAFLGIKVKNKLDERRLQIKQKYNPKLVAHFKSYSQLEPIYLYGVEVYFKSKYKKLLELLNKKIFLKNSCNYEKFLQTYRMLLASYDLSCHSCYGYLADGLYPIDVCYINTVCRKNYSKELESGFQYMMQQTRTPPHLNIRNLNLFVLGKSTGYDTYHI